MVKQKLTRQMLEAMASQVIAIKTKDDFFYFLGKQYQPVFAIPQNKRYHIFKIPKRNKNWRQIEDPVPPLKALQRVLLRYFQCLYATLMPGCSYGFIIGVEGEQPKNIYTNACQHIGKDYLINMDIEDFFTSIKTERIKQLFMNSPFQYNTDLAEMLADICTLNGHLPTGAPTSPVLSNFISLQMDTKINSFCDDTGISYTRFVDDITVSAKEPISDEVLNYITTSIADEQFTLNQTKFRKFGPTDNKEVTGLALKQKPDVSDTFLNDLKNSIEEYCRVKQMQHFFGPGTTSQNQQRSLAYNKLAESIDGALNFLKFVRGSKDPVYIDLKEKMASGFFSNGYLLNGYYSLAF